jgi:hypothetical protein
MKRLSKAFDTTLKKLSAGLAESKLLTDPFALKNTWLPAYNRCKGSPFLLILQHIIILLFASYDHI